MTSGGRKLHHEDLEVGRPYSCGHKTVTKAEIIAFARAYDPQPMHLDEDAAKATLAGGLCASGFHTCGIMMRMICDGLLNDVASLGAPGVDEVRWKQPVRPGDALTTRYLITEKRDLASRPDVGISKVLVELRKSDGTVAANWITNQMVRRRHPGSPVPTAAATGKPARQPLVSLWDVGPAADPPVADRYFEDREIGETTAFGCHTFAKDEIIAFASQFDPQPFHLDEAAGKASLFGGLSASGWHTAAIFIREIVTARMRTNGAARAAGVPVPAVGPSPGFRNLRWPKPVYPGDTIEFRGRITEKIDFKTRPERGLLASEVQGRNQHGDIVFAITSQILVERRRPLQG